MTNAQRLQQANTARQWNERKRLNGWKPSEKGESVEDAVVSNEGIVIDAEFKALIPALSADEYAALESSLLSEGCRDALVVWPHDGVQTLIDGHNRYGLCLKHGLTYNVVERAFDSREDVIVWMVRNQLARRNLTDFSRAELVLKMTSVVDAIKAKAKANQLINLKQGDDSPVSTNLSKRESVDTRAELSMLAEVSQGTLSKVRRVIKDAPEFVKEKARTGDISTHRAEEMTKELTGADDDILDIVEHFDIEDVGTITLLKHLHKEERESFQHIRDTGSIQITDDEDAVPVTAPSALLYEAVRKRSDMHRSIAGQAKGGVPPALQMSKSNEWYTPAAYIDGVREVMGWIDIDPASNAEANQLVRATVFYDQFSDGLSHPWDGKVFVNPPYGRDDISNQERWSHRLIEQYRAGITTEAILLVNAVTDRAWFQPLWDFPICFTDHRVPFYRPGGEAGAQPVCGSAFVYFGDNPDGFAEVFKRFGAVVMRVIRGGD
jgi:hypothetical protein